MNKCAAENGYRVSSRATWFTHTHTHTNVHCLRGQDWTVHPDCPLILVFGWNPARHHKWENKKGIIVRSTVLSKHVSNTLWGGQIQIWCSGARQKCMPRHSWHWNSNRQLLIKWVCVWVRAHPSHETIHSRAQSCCCLYSLPQKRLEKEAYVYVWVPR